MNANNVNRARMNKTVFKRQDEKSEWTTQVCESISAAKRVNGPNSTTVRSLSQLPKRVEAA